MRFCLIFIIIIQFGNHCGVNTTINTIQMMSLKGVNYKICSLKCIQYAFNAPDKMERVLCFVCNPFPTQTINHSIHKACNAFLLRRETDDCSNVMELLLI